MSGGTASTSPLPAPQLPTAVEWPTVAVAISIYLAFGLITWFHAALPWWLLLPLGGFVVAWQGSLQHEVVHGHPTPWRIVNRLLVLPSLWLWLPFEHYRASHLAHHRDENLTDPLLDPESYYITAAHWARLSPLGRSLRRAMNSLLGRLLLGPFHCTWRYGASQVRALAEGRFDVATWSLHLLGSALALGWAVGLAGMSPWSYLLCFAYAGTALTLLRSFLEHRARPEVGERTVVVEAGPLFSLLFLNNNLHAVHHAHPGLAWYRLPSRYLAARDDYLARNGGYRYGGYGEIARRFLLSVKEPPVHPAEAAQSKQPRAPLAAAAVLPPLS